MENMPIILFRIAILCFVAFLVGIFKEPLYLCFLFMLIFTRKRMTRKTITQEFDAVHDRLDALLQVKNAIEQQTTKKD